MRPSTNIGSHHPPAGLHSNSLKMNPFYSAL
nr:MAG TPA: hypothetical protein [Caudoviricetes sp.]